MRVRLFARARETAGAGELRFDVEDVPRLGALRSRLAADLGGDFAAVLATSRLWINGDEPDEGDGSVLHDDDEVAVLPPVSGG